jgi:hypothetical protein
MPPDSPFAQRPYIAVLNNKETPEDEWEYGPITAEALFGKCTARLVKWADIKEPTARSNRKGYTQLKETVHLSSTQCCPFMEAKSVKRWSAIRALWTQ